MYLVKDQINVTLLARESLLQALLREQLHQWHERVPHVRDAPFLLVDVGSVHHQPLQAGD